MSFATLRSRMLAGETLVGTFLKVPAIELVEILATTGLDFICIDAEHAPVDRARMDGCLAIARALDFPVLVRVPAATPENLLMALDSGAVGVVCPHIDSPEKAADIARAARFGNGGRGFAGSTRWAGFNSRGMADILAQSREETIVLAQIEEPAGVEAADAIAATPGIDGLFIGPADLSVAMGKTDQTSDELMAAYARVGEACKARGKANVTFVGDAARARLVAEHGVTVFFVASELTWMAQGARAVSADIKGSG
ncbi:HpcH/HpaI aldolase family protein [Ovoidimarina sediminis]|uniref:HpcH/HpaI aldolase family protein n=1 Tax=Ovoidimarina sediminis TaxID=3079856 RepID=UPI002915541B|nr:aldolase/citrate lyase family protein [Rhodophyticola sp. MJ-SS7]MDU8943067.1 aldolase/citrate lyase family protein [Rhodophyticola sp. MJ-SS7]